VITRHWNVDFGDWYVFEIHLEGATLMPY